MSIKVSVIIPVYNAGTFLTQCLDSVINQTLQNIEIICVNDGSTDNSLEILQDYAIKDSRIKIISQENSGVATARNIGIDCATGEFIGFLDADDLISDRFYELLYTNAVKSCADIACGEIVRPNALKKQNFYNLRKIKTYETTYQKYRICEIPQKAYTTNKIYKKSSLLKSGVRFEDGKVYEDILWMHKVLYKLNRLVTVPNAVYYYNVNPKSITNTKNNKNKKDHYEANNESIKFIVEKRIPISNFKFYKALKRIRINFLGIRIFDIKIWQNLKVIHFLGLPVIIIYIDNHIL